MTELKIVLENRVNSVYYPGGKIKGFDKFGSGLELNFNENNKFLSGIIELNLTESTEINGLFFIIYGRAMTQWTNETNSDEQFLGTEIYLKRKTYLVGQASVIAAGSHYYNFEYQLPPNIPPSFEKFGKFYGSIHYNIAACLEVPFGYQNEYKLGFLVVNDLNNFPELKIPCKEVFTKKFCCLFCKSDPLTVSVTIPFSGFTSGATIPIRIRYINESKVEIGRTLIYILRIIKFTSDKPFKKSKYEEQKIVEVIREGVESSIEKTVVERLKLPNELFDTNDSYSKTIQVSYYLIIEPEAIGCYYGFDICLPIVIGSVPLNFDDVAEETPVPVQASAVRLFPETENGPMPCILELPEPSPIYSDLPPPSYEEAVKSQNNKTNMKVWNKDQNG